MKFLIIYFFSLIIIANVTAQLSNKEERTFLKAERLYDKKKEWKATEKLEPILKKHISEPRLWSAMIKYEISGYREFLDVNDYASLGDENVKIENTIVIDSSLDAQLDRILKKLYRTFLYGELVQMLEDADKNCEKFENICEYVDIIKYLGQEKTSQGNRTKTLFEKHKQVISKVEKNNCY